MLHNWWRKLEINPQPYARIFADERWLASRSVYLCLDDVLGRVIN